MSYNRPLRERLPAAVYDLAIRLGGVATSAPSPIRLSQNGQLREAGGSAWRRFRAVQTIWTDRCAFEWSARLGFGGCVRVQDALLETGGQLEVSMLGVLPLARMHSNPALTQGELLRYLAELAWAPEAIARNETLQWTVLAADRIRVAAEMTGVQAQITFTLDSRGLIAEAFAEERPRAVRDGFTFMPWRARFADYRCQDGLWTPSLGRACWIGDGRPEMVWEGRQVRRAAASAAARAPSSRRWGAPAGSPGERA